MVDKKFGAGYEIIVEGRPIDNVVIVKEGRCEITKKGLNKVSMNQESGLVEMKFKGGASLQSNVILG